MLLFVWACAALSLAAVRVPFDDEWFSIELAFDATAPQLWAALSQDVHPPWLPLLDRALAALGPEPLWLQGARVLVSAAAIALGSLALARELAVPRALFVLAAAHPLVLFYAGAARWYPLLWLAQALRALALWHVRPAGVASGALFVSGSVLGSLASYLDPLFVAHDAVWLALRSARERRRWLPAAGIALIAGAALLALRAASPLHGSVHDGLVLSLPQWQWRTLAVFYGLGLTGEAALPWPWAALGLACVLACGWAVLLALRARSTRPATLFLLSHAACWLVACGFGVDHPRYALLLWSVLPCLWLRWLLSAATSSRVQRAVAGCALIHLVLALGLVFTGRGFFKADLNRLDAADCAPLTAASGARAVLVTYARLEQLVRNQCASSLPLVRVPSIRIRPEALAQLEALSSSGSLWLLSVNTEASYARTAARLREQLTARCSLQSSTDFGRIPHPGLSARRSTDYRRFKLEHFACGRQ